MFHDICLHVARSYTSSPDSPFSFISSLTLSNHSLRPSSLPPPLYFHFHHTPSYVVLLSSDQVPTTSTSFPVCANHYRGDVISDLQAAGKPRDQARRCHHPVSRRLQVLHHHQATQPPLHPGGIHQGHPRQLHPLPKVSVTSKVTFLSGSETGFLVQSTGVSLTTMDWFQNALGQRSQILI